MKLFDALLLAGGGYLLYSAITSKGSAAAEPVAEPQAVAAAKPALTPTLGTGALGTGVTIAYVDPATQTTYGTYNTPTGGVSGVISPLIMAASTTTQSSGTTSTPATTWTSKDTTKSYYGQLVTTNSLGKIVKV